MSHDFSEAAKKLLQERKQLQDQVIVTPEVWVREMHNEPSTPYFRTNNFLQNTLSRLVGWYPTLADWRRILCDAQGRLEVSTIQASYDHNDVKSGSAADAFGAFIAFDDIAKRVDIFVWDNALNFARGVDGISLDDTLEIPANTIFSFDGTTHSFKVRNTVAGQIARYKVVGWW